MTEVYDPEFGTVDVTVATLTADFELKEMESVLTVQDTFFFGSPEAFADTKTYEETAESQRRRCQNDVRRHGPGRLGRPHDLDGARRLGSHRCPVRWVTRSGREQPTDNPFRWFRVCYITMLAPIVWYVLLPLERNVRLHVDDSLFWVSLCLGGIHGHRSNSSPSYGLILSILSGITSVAMVVAVTFRNQAEPVVKSPGG